MPNDIPEWTTLSCRRNPSNYYRMVDSDRGGIGLAANAYLASGASGRLFVSLLFCKL